MYRWLITLVVGFVLLASLSPATAQPPKEQDSKEAPERLEAYAKTLLRTALGFKRTKLEIELSSLKNSRESVTRVGGMYTRMIMQMMEEKEFTLPPTGEWKTLLVHMKQGSTLNRNLDDVFGTRDSTPELDAPEFIIGHVLGEKPPEKPSAVQRKLIEAAKGKTGKPAIRAMIEETERLLSDADKRLTKQEAEIKKSVEMIRQKEKELEEKPKEKKP